MIFITNLLACNFLNSEVNLNQFRQFLHQNDRQDQLFNTGPSVDGFYIFFVRSIRTQEPEDILLLSVLEVVQAIHHN